ASATSSRVATPPATTATSGPRCCRPTASPRSRRKGSSIRKPGRDSCGRFCRSVEVDRPSTRSGRSEVASPVWRPCSDIMGWSKKPPERPRPGAMQVARAGAAGAVQPMGNGMKRILVDGLVLVAVATVAVPAAAQYKWRSPEGTVVYSDVPPATGARLMGDRSAEEPSVAVAEESAPAQVQLPYELKL